MFLLTIVDFDRKVFSLINNGLTSDFLDTILVLWRNEYVWIPLYIFIISFVVLNFKQRSLWYLFFLVLNFGVTDIVSSSVIKPLVERPRPCHGETMNLDVRLLVDCGSGFSFTSSHATNHFGLAFFLIFTLGKRWKYIIAPLIVWAVIVAYAQVYVGVHYPLDVLSGALLGICIAFMLSEMYKFTIRKLEYRKHKV